MGNGYDVVHVDDLARVPVAHGLEWRPIRRRLGIRAFGMNAYTSERPGDWLVEEHEESTGHEEVYVVLSGRARFTVGGEDFDAPAGTIVFIGDSGVKRKAVSVEDGATVLAVGGWPGRPFEPSSWEWFFEAYAQEPAQGVETMEAALKERGERPELLYHLACLEARAGRADDARRHLDRAIVLRPEAAERAAQDDDLKALLDGG